jgi:SAM-dependent methyltransferase
MSEDVKINPLSEFVRRCRQITTPVVAELGTRRSIASRSTKHDVWTPHASRYVGIDIQEGLDVDIVADVHTLADTVGEEQFDAIISCSSFEHFKYPHLAAHQIMRSLKPGGLVFIQTHQTFPLHAFPFDYFRFSREALEGLFGTRMGMDVIAVDYEFPAVITNPNDPLLAQNPAFLNVRLLGVKTAATPREYIYEL